MAYPHYGSINSAECTPISNVPPTMPALELLNKSLDARLSQANDVLCRTRMLADRIFGAVPEPVGNDKTEPKPTAVMSSIRQADQFLDSILVDLSRQLQRLEAL